MKKLLIIIMVCFVMALSLASCGNNTGAPADTQAEETADNDAAAAGGEDVPEGEPADGTASEAEDEPADGAGETPAAGQTNAPGEFTEVTVVENDACAIVVSGLGPDNHWGYTVNVSLENKSADKTYMYTVRGGAVNGVQINLLFAAEVPAGEKANEGISFDTSDLEELGIDEYTDIELTFRVYNSDEWTEEAALETVHIYPYGEENATTYTRPAQSTDTVILDNEYVSATFIGYEIDEIFGYTVKMLLVNKMDEEVFFFASNISVNGYTADSMLSTGDLLPGKCALGTMSWDDSVFEEKGITDVEEIEFLLRAFDYSDWSRDDFANERVTINP